MKCALLLLIICLSGILPDRAATAPADSVEVRITYVGNDSVFRFYYPFDDGKPADIPRE
jgi:hypothetical protein